MVPASACAWHHLVVYFVLLAAAIAILVGVVVVAMGRGGELARFRRDLPPVPPRITTAADIGALDLPLALFGYQDEAADAAFAAAAKLLVEQDAEITRLRAQVGRLTVPPNGDAAPNMAASERQQTRDAVSGQPQPQP